MGRRRTGRASKSRRLTIRIRSARSRATTIAGHNTGSVCAARALRALQSPSRFGSWSPRPRRSAIRPARGASRSRSSPDQSARPPCTRRGCRQYQRAHHDRASNVAAPSCPKQRFASAHAFACEHDDGPGRAGESRTCRPNPIQRDCEEQLSGPERGTGTMGGTGPAPVVSGDRPRGRSHRTQAGPPRVEAHHPSGMNR